MLEVVRNQDLYRDLCQNHKITIFSTDWWLDAVVGKNNWEAIIVKDDNEIVGAFPYCIQKTAKIFKGIYNPHLTPRIELFLKDRSVGQNPDDFKNRTLNAIIEALPKTSLFSVSFHYHFTSAKPFLNHHFQVRTRHSYLFDDLSDIEKVYANFSNRAKYEIRKAQKSLKIIQTDDFDFFFNTLIKSFESKRSLPYQYKIFKSIETFCKNRNRRIIILAESEREIAGSAYLVWDHQYLYYLASGINPMKRSSGVGSFLILEAIRIASEMKLKFDFEGSMIAPVEFFYQSFNPRKQEYYTIYKYNNLLLKFIKEWRKKDRGSKF